MIKTHISKIGKDLYTLHIDEIGYTNKETITSKYTKFDLSKKELDDLIKDIKEIDTSLNVKEFVKEYFS